MLPVFVLRSPVMNYLFAACLCVEITCNELFICCLYLCWDNQ